MKGGESCIISVLAEEVDLPDGLPAGAFRQPPLAGQMLTQQNSSPWDRFSKASFFMHRDGGLLDSFLCEGTGGLLAVWSLASLSNFIEFLVCMDQLYDLIMSIKCVTQN